MAILKVRVVREHPTGVRYRAGMQFTREARDYEMDQAQAEAVTADGWLEVLEHIKGCDATPACDPDEADAAAGPEDGEVDDGGDGSDDDAGDEGDAADPDSTPEPVVDFDAMTVAQLREYADGHGIALGDARRKADILAAVKGA